MSVADNFYHKRRSVLARKMLSDPIKDEDLNTILNAGIRVPDHGALNPWKIVVIKKDKLKTIDEEIILPEIISENMTLSNEQPYAVIENLTVLDGVTLSIDHGSEIRMPLGGNILIEGRLIINGNEDMPVKIKTRDSNVENRWGALCFNHTSDTSIISFLNMSKYISSMSWIC